MPAEKHNLLELANENAHISSDLIRSSSDYTVANTTLSNMVSRSLTAGEQLAGQVFIPLSIIM